MNTLLAIFSRDVVEVIAQHIHIMQTHEVIQELHGKVYDDGDGAIMFRTQHSIHPLQQRRITDDSDNTIGRFDLSFFAHNYRMTFLPKRYHFSSGFDHPFAMDDRLYYLLE